MPIDHQPGAVPVFHFALRRWSAPFELLLAPMDYNLNASAIAVWLRIFGDVAANIQRRIDYPARYAAIEPYGRIEVDPTYGLGDLSRSTLDRALRLLCKTSLFDGQPMLVAGRVTSDGWIEAIVPPVDLVSVSRAKPGTVDRRFVAIDPYDDVARIARLRTFSAVRLMLFALYNTRRTQKRHRVIITREELITKLCLPPKIARSNLLRTLRDDPKRINAAWPERSIKVVPNSVEANRGGRGRLLTDFLVTWNNFSVAEGEEMDRRADESAARRKAERDENERQKKEEAKMDIISQLIDGLDDDVGSRLSKPKRIKPRATPPLPAPRPTAAGALQLYDDDYLVFMSAPPVAATGPFDFVEDLGEPVTDLSDEPPRPPEGWVCEGPTDEEVEREYDFTGVTGDEVVGPFEWDEATGAQIEIDYSAAFDPEPAPVITEDEAVAALREAQTEAETTDTDDD